MFLNIEGEKLIKHYEKCRLEAYLPTPKDRWTIGWGTTFVNGSPVKQGMKITQKQADRYFILEIERLEHLLSQFLKVELDRNQWSACISLMYNIGVGNFSQSTLLEMINKRQFKLAAGGFSKWIRQKGVVLPGLVKRRAEEKELFLKPYLVADLVLLKTPVA